MSERFDSRRDFDADLLSDEHLDAVIGGAPGFPGLAPNESINISPFAHGAFGSKWAMVGATGHL
jgi:hypothetical protein